MTNEIRIITSVQALPFVSAHRWRIGVHFGAEVAKHNEWFGFADILEGYAAPGPIFSAEIFVLGQLGEADEFGAIEGLAIDFADALDANEAVSAVVLDAALGARLDGEFFGSEKLFAIDFAIDNPAVHVALFARIGYGDGFEIVIIFELRVHVGFPIELLDDPVEVFVLAAWHVFNKEGPGHFTALDEGLIHRKHVAAPLRLVGAERAGSVEDARTDEPAAARFK